MALPFRLAAVFSPLGGLFVFFYETIAADFFRLAVSPLVVDRIVYMFAVVVLQLKSACLLLEWQVDDKAMVVFVFMAGQLAVDFLDISNHFLR